jgi:hypothetical protein
LRHGIIMRPESGHGTRQSGGWQVVGGRWERRWTGYGTR